MRLLIADDELNVRDGLASLFHDVAPDVRIVGFAQTVEETIQLVSIHKPEIVLLDIRMPGGSGLDAVAVSSGSHLPLWIVVTAYPEFEYAQRAISLDVFEYLLKPVSSKEMRTVIDAARLEVAKRIRETSVLAAGNAEAIHQSPKYDVAMLAKTHIDSQYSRPIGVTQIADQLGLSPNYLSTVFRRRHGESPLHYLTRVRMEEAAKLLLDGYRVKEVAGLVGFQDARYFSRLFTRHWGKRPTEYVQTFTDAVRPGDETP